MNYTELSAEVTARLVEQIETGPGAWRMPWHDVPGLLDVRNAATTSPYRGADAITLAVAAVDRGYSSRWWATYKQWAALGAQVRRGETAARIVKWVTTHRPSHTGDDTDDEQGRLVPRVYAVFNAAQGRRLDPTGRLVE